MKKYLLLFLSAMVFLVSCTGPQGEEGPAGPEGPPGPEQPGLYYIRMFQNNVYSSDYTGQIQACLYNSMGGAYYTDASEPVEIGTDDVGSMYRAIFKFDLSDLPSSKVIVDTARLIIKTNSQNYGGGAADVTIHKLLEPWVEFEAGWDNSSNTTSWGSGDSYFSAVTMTADLYSRDLPPSSTITIWLDTDVVHDWLVNPSTNYGLIMVADDEFAPGYYSRIYSGGDEVALNHPKLQITYYTYE